MNKLFLSSIVFLFSNFALAETILEVEKQIFKVVQEQAKKECAECIIELEIMNKKVIEDIAIPDKVMADHWKGQTNLALMLDGQTRIVTANIRWLDKVVVAQENVRLGQSLEEKDLRVVEKDVTYLNEVYVRDKKDVIGLLGKRVIKRGQVIDESYLKKPIVVRYGQPIKLQLNEGSLQVTMNARAKGAGAIGDQIPVFIPNTRKKLMAEIIDQATVRVR